MRRGGGLFFSSLFLSTAFVVACSSASSSTNGTGGAGSGGGGTGGINVGGSGAISVGGNGGSGALTGCSSQLYDGELVPLDMYLMLDKSGSMDSSQNNTWGPVTTAISQFVDLPGLAKLGMGLGLFPAKPSTPAASGQCATNADCGFYECIPGFNACSGWLSPNDSCVATDYQTPVVPIADLPGVGATIKSAMASASPDGSSTTMTPALEGAIDIATIHAQQVPDHISVVVLATDGEPNNCSNNSVAAAAAIAKEGYDQTPSIRTFVIGMGSLATLDTIASAGGTDKAILVSTGNAGQEFLAALDKIRGAVSCQFLVPQDGKSDPKKVNIQFTPEGAQSGDLFPQVDGLASCQGNKGWYYDNPSAPTQILLCPAACDQVKNVTGKVEVVFGCPTIVN
jgi:hypothetical protein